MFIKKIGSTEILGKKETKNIKNISIFLGEEFLFSITKNGNTVEGVIEVDESIKDIQLVSGLTLPKLDKKGVLSDVENWTMGVSSGTACIKNDEGTPVLQLVIRKDKDESYKLVALRSNMNGRGYEYVLDGYLPEKYVKQIKSFEELREV